MRRRNRLHISKQCRDAAVFLCLCVLLACGMMISQDNRDRAPSDRQPAAEPGRADDESIPDEVMGEAEGLASREWDYVRRAFPERSYCEYKLDDVRHVRTCRHIEGESFEVYGITCSYRRNGSEEWEYAENAANSFLVFRAGNGGPMEWIDGILTDYEPGTEEFETEVHAALMRADEQYLFKLLADGSLEQTLEKTLYQYLRSLIPGDYVYHGWKPLAQETAGDSGQVYGVLLYHTSSGSPLIFSEETQRYVAAIHSTCLLPIRVTYQRDGAGRYAVTALWMPAANRYERDIREAFPAETAGLVLENLDQYAADLLRESGAGEGDEVFSFFTGGPVWPAYAFDAALDDATLCALADYYRDGDLYCEPVRKELLRRFGADPAGLLNGLGACSEETLETVCRIIGKAGIDPESIPQSALTAEGRTAYERLASCAGGETGQGQTKSSTA